MTAPQVGLEPTTLRLTVGAEADAGQGHNAVQREKSAPALPTHAEETPHLPNVPRETPRPLLIAARLVKGGTLRHCDSCGRAISSSWPLRLTYREGRSVFVVWVHPHTCEDEGQLPCAPDVPLVHAVLP